MRPWLPWILALLAVAALVIADLRYGATRWFPTGYDEITHLQHAASVKAQIEGDGLAGLRAAWEGAYDTEELGHYWPAALYIATAPLLDLAPGHPQAPLLALPILLCLMVGAAALGAASLGEALGVGRRGAPWAVWLFALPPIAAVSSRHYLPTVAVAALAGVGALALARSDGYRRLGWAAAAGALAGLGMMSDRLIFAPAFAPAALACLTFGRRGPRAWAGAGLAGLVAAAIAGPYYLRWWQSWGATVFTVFTRGDGGGLGRAAGWVEFFATGGWAGAAGLAVLVGLVALPWARLCGLEPEARGELATWVGALGGGAVLLQGSDSAHTYLAAILLVPLSVLGGVGWGRWVGGWGRPVGLAAALTAVAVAWQALTLGVGSGRLWAWDPWQDGRGPAEMRTGFHWWVPGEGGSWIPRETPAPGTPTPGAPTPTGAPGATPGPTPPPSPTPPRPILGDEGVDAFLAAHPPAAIVDLVQDKSHWSGLWLHYRASLAGTSGAVDWPLRRHHAGWAAAGPFMEDPCALAGIVVVHPERAWDAPSGLDAPPGLLGMSDRDARLWRRAVRRTRACFTAAPPLRGPMGGWITLLTRGASPAPPTGPCAGDPCPEEDWEGPCPSDMALIPGGRYDLSIPGGPTGAYEGELGPVDLPAFCMDRYEHPGALGALPTVEVSQEEASLLCQDVGKRLCAEVEWEGACRGREGRRFSYGPARDPARCHTAASPGEGPSALLPIGAFPECVSPDGVHDLDGSVSEIVADTRPGPPFPEDAGAGEAACGVLRGGTLWPAAYGQDCLSRHWHPTGHRQEDDGFRCCKDARGLPR